MAFFFSLRIFFDHVLLQLRVIQQLDMGFENVCAFSFQPGNDR